MAVLGGAAATWPLAAWAQRVQIPVIGWLGSGSPETFANDTAAFRRGLIEAGFVEGKTVTIEYRWAEGRYDRLPALAAELVHRPVAAILASGGGPPTRAAMAATAMIPIVFTAASDPVALGLVASLNRPGGNVTGVNFRTGEARTKLLGLLHEVVPAAKVMGALLNPNSATTDAAVDELEMAARSLGVQLRVLKASTEREIDEAFEGLAQQRPDALLVETEPFLSGRRDQIISQATRLGLPTINSDRRFAAAGGLMNYGPSIPDAYHQAGLYVARILKGEKPADLPVVQSVKLDLLINLKTAKALGLTIPPGLFAIADEVIE